MSFQALGAIAKFKRANTKKKNLLSRPKAPTMSRKVSSNSAKVISYIKLKIIWKKIKSCCKFTLTENPNNKSF